MFMTVFEAHSSVSLKSFWHVALQHQQIEAKCKIAPKSDLNFEC